jgi:hypothetical protein
MAPRPVRRVDKGCISPSHARRPLIVCNYPIWRGVIAHDDQPARFKLQAGRTVHFTPGVTVVQRSWIAATRGREVVIHDHRLGQIKSDIRCISR